MNNKITKTIKKFNMISSGDCVLLGVSGGADSMLMLDYFVRNRDELGITVKVAHIEHGLRGKASVEDALFVENFCKNHNVEFNLLSIDAKSGASQEGMSVEEYSRIKRYDFFSSIPCDKIATAHNLSDNVETFIFRLARGTGLKGACGIPPVRDNIIRPLIELSSAEIRQYCIENIIEFRNDETNFQNDYSRNKIRNIVLPALSQINGDCEEKLSDFIADVNECYSFIDKAVDCEYNNLLHNNMIDLELLRQYDIPLQKQIILRYFADNDIVLDRLHLNDIIALVSKSGKIQIKGSSFAVSTKKYLRIADFNSYATQQLYFPFESEILNISEFDAKDIDFYCDCDKISGNVVMRARMSDDKLTLANRNCTKSIKKLFNEMAVPIELRNKIGMICDDNGVIGFVYNGRSTVDERVKLTDSTKRVLVIKIPLED